MLSLAGNSLLRTDGCGGMGQAGAYGCFMPACSHHINFLLSSAQARCANSLTAAASKQRMR